METTIYQNNEVTITLEKVDFVEYKVNINGQNLIWISGETKERFIEDLKNLLDEHRI